MKKLMIIAVGLSLVLSAGATTVKWGLASGQTLSDISSGTIYLVYGSVPSTDWSSMKSYKESDLTGQVVQSATLTGGTYTDNTGVSITPSDIGATGNGMKTFYEAVIADDGLTIAISNAKNINISTSPMTMSGQWTASSFTTYTANIPEPTSGLLLLFGAGMLALRRKQK